MSDLGVARVNADQAGGPVSTGAKTVFVENQKAAFVGSIIGGKPNTGDIIVQSPTNVFVENKKIATVGAITARGHAVAKASTTVFAGDSSKK
jgi:uncharacterized Zn-binding protein involved in type VI secretion